MKSIYAYVKEIHYKRAYPRKIYIMITFRRDRSWTFLPCFFLCLLLRSSSIVDYFICCIFFVVIWTLKKLFSFRVFFNISFIVSYFLRFWFCNIYLLCILFSRIITCAISYPLIIYIPYFQKPRNCKLCHPCFPVSNLAWIWRSVIFSFFLLISDFVWI